MSKTVSANFTGNLMLSTAIGLPKKSFPKGFYLVRFKGEKSTGKLMDGIFFRDEHDVTGALMTRTDPFPFDGETHEVAFYLEDPSSYLLINVNKTGTAKFSFTLEYEENVDKFLNAFREELYYFERQFYNLTSRVAELEKRLDEKSDAAVNFKPISRSAYETLRKEGKLDPSIYYIIN